MTGSLTAGSPAHPAGESAAPSHVSDLEFLGPYEGSGFNDQRFLVRRSDGQVIHLSRLLYLVLTALDGRRSAAEAAELVSLEYGRELDVEGLHFLIEEKLRPLGVIASGEEPRPLPRADPLLAVRLHGTLVPASVAHRAGRLLAFVYAPAVVAGVVTAILIVDGWLLRYGDLGNALQQTLLTPSFILLGAAALVASALFHEFGHAAACVYGGGRCGPIGVGLYLMWPAFYTDVTDTYRLPRAARLRTDLGGVYFTGLLALGCGLAYVATGEGLLLLMVLLLHIEAAQQLLPLVRLDGYYALGDLVGVPDLFGRVRPILKSFVPGRPVDPRVTELRPRVRVAVGLWVLVVVPVLTAGLVLLVVQLPTILSTTWESLQIQVAFAREAWAAVARAADLVPVAAAGLSILLLVLPLVGLAAVLMSLLSRMIRYLSRGLHRTIMGTSRSARSPARHLEAPLTSSPESSGPAATSQRSGDAAVPDPSGSGVGGIKKPSDTGPPAADVPAGTLSQAGTSAPATSSAGMSPAGTSPAGMSPVQASPGATSAGATSAGATSVGATSAGATPSAGTSPADVPGAAAFTDEAMLRLRSHPPSRGWRRALFRGTGGLINPGPSRSEREQLSRTHRVGTPVTNARRIVVLSRKGGVGKTTTALMLGHTLSMSRGDRVVAVDANPDAGNLAYRIPGRNPKTVTSLLQDQWRIESYTDLRRYTSLAPSRLEVLASDDDPRITQRLGDFDYRLAIKLLDRHYSLIVVDTGTGILDPATQGMLEEADHLVVVMPPALDGARAAASTLDWLDEHGHDHLVKGAVAVVNGVRGPTMLDLDRIEEHFTERCAAVVRIPWDHMLEAGAQTGPDELRPETRTAYLELAASVAQQFAAPGGREVRLAKHTTHTATSTRSSESQLLGPDGPSARSESPLGRYDSPSSATDSILSRLESRSSGSGSSLGRSESQPDRPESSIRRTKAGSRRSERTSDSLQNQIAALRGRTISDRTTPSSDPDHDSPSGRRSDRPR